MEAVAQKARVCYGTYYDKRKRNELDLHFNLHVIYKSL